MGEIDKEFRQFINRVSAGRYTHPPPPPPPVQEDSLGLLGEHDNSSIEVAHCRYEQLHDP